MLGLKRNFVAAQKLNNGEPVVKADKPWEGLNAFAPGFCTTSVLHNGTHFRMYYRAWQGGLALAESENGLEWEKPALKIYDVNKYLASPSGKMDIGKARKEGFYD